MRFANYDDDNAYFIRYTQFYLQYNNKKENKNIIWQKVKLTLVTVVRP